MALFTIGAIIVTDEYRSDCFVLYKQFVYEIINGTLRAFLVATDKYKIKRRALVCPWPVVGLSAKKAVKRIHSKTMVYGIKPGQRLDARCGIMKISDGGGYSLFTGEEHLNPNLSGLLLSVSSKRATAFLTADHSNHQIWDEMYAELKDEWKELNIVVPHHGGNGGKSSGPKGKNPGQAVISVGNNHYGHPKKAVIKSYESAGFKVSRTDIKKDDIDIIM